MRYSNIDTNQYNIDHSPEVQQIYFLDDKINKFSQKSSPGTFKKDSFRTNSEN